MLRLKGPHTFLWDDWMINVIPVLYDFIQTIFWQSEESEASILVQISWYLRHGDIRSALFLPRWILVFTVDLLHAFVQICNIRDMGLSFECVYVLVECLRCLSQKLIVVNRLIKYTQLYVTHPVHTMLAKMCVCTMRRLL